MSASSPTIHTMIKLIVSTFLLSLIGFVSCQYDHEGAAYQPHSQFNKPPASILLHKQALGQDGSFNYAFAADNGLQQGEIINPDGSRKGSYSYVDPNGKTVSLSYTAGKDGFRVLDGDHVPKAPEQLQKRPNSQYHQPQQGHLPRPNSVHVHYPQQEVPTPHYSAPYKGSGIPYETYKNTVNAPAYRGNSVPYDETHKNVHHHNPPAPPPLPSTHVGARYNTNSARYDAPYRQAPQTPHFSPAPQYQPHQYSVQEGNYEKPSPYMAHQYGGHHRQEQPQKPHSFGNGFAFEFAG